MMDRKGLRSALAVSLVIGAFGIMLSSSTQASTTTTTKTTTTTTTTVTTTEKSGLNYAEQAKKVKELGYKLTIASGYQSSITFNYVDTDTVNANATDIKKVINVYRGLVQVLSNDEELAAVMSHEIAHILNEHSSVGSLRNYGLNLASSYTQSKIGNSWAQQGVGLANDLTKSKLTRVDEYEADRAACDIMVKAGYNPLALISALNSFGSKYNDFFYDHPSTEKRNISIYDYVNSNYPEFIAKGYDTVAYKSAMIDINAELNKRKNNPAEQAKIAQKQMELKQTRANLEQKTATNNKKWNNTYNAVNVGLQIFQAIK